MCSGSFHDEVKMSQICAQYMYSKYSISAKLEDWHCANQGSNTFGIIDTQAFSQRTNHVDITKLICMWETLMKGRQKTLSTLVICCVE